MLVFNNELPLLIGTYGTILGQPDQLKNTFLRKGGSMYSPSTFHRADGVVTLMVHSFSFPFLYCQRHLVSYLCWKCKPVFVLITTKRSIRWFPLWSSRKWMNRALLSRLTSIESLTTSVTSLFCSSLMDETFGNLTSSRCALKWPWYPQTPCCPITPLRRISPTAITRVTWPARRYTMLLFQLLPETLLHPYRRYVVEHI